MIEDSCLYSNVPAEAVAIAILKYASFHSLRCLMNWKSYIFWTVFLAEQCAVSKVTTRVFKVQSFVLDTGPQSFWFFFCYSFIALLIIRCLKSAQQLAVHMCQVLLWKARNLSQLKKLLTMLRISYVILNVAVRFLPRDAMHKRGYAVMRCLSVCLSVCHVRELRQNK